MSQENKSEAKISPSADKAADKGAAKRPERSAEKAAEKAGEKARAEIAADDTAYLMKLAARVRAARAQRGMTRKILARDSQVSERYLAQLEAGEGNASVLVLRKIARAMDFTLEDLLTESLDRPVDQRLIIELLNRLDSKDLAEARQLLNDRFARRNNNNRSGKLRISLIGLRGAGKSTLGRRLAEHLAVPFVEVNRLIEEEYGAPVAEILEWAGQPTYRRYEKKALERAVSENDRVVIATGGSIVTEPATLDYLLANTLTIWLRASPEEHMQRVIAQGDRRPMAKNREAMEDLKHILKARDRYYSKANLQLDTAGRTEDESFADLVALVQPYL